ncbi:MAG: hypothetical protein WC702_00800 [Patescibacteria group bacterium]|jgi:hypothetical protein
MSPEQSYQSKAAEIRAILQSLGLEDFEAVGVLINFIGQYYEVGRETMMLSELCALRASGLAARLGVDPRSIHSTITIMFDSLKIGSVNKNGSFDFESAPDLRSALLWRVATGGGPLDGIKAFDPDETAEELKRINRQLDKDMAAFFAPWFYCLRTTLERCSLFDDSWHRSSTIMWRVATRELGCEHYGYWFGSVHYRDR